MFSQYHDDFQDIYTEALSKFDVNKDDLIDKNEFRDFIMANFDQKPLPHQ